MVDTRCVCDDEGRTVIGFGLAESSQSLFRVSAHCNLCYVYIAVCHSDLSKVFLLYCLTGSSEFSYGTDRSCLGGLSACVGVNLCIEYEDVYVLSGSKNVVNTAVTDIVCPTVTAEDPH